MNRKSSKLLLLFLCALCWRGSLASASEPLVVKYLGNHASLVSEDYYLALINAALQTTESTHGSYKVVYIQEPLSSERKHELLVGGEKINVDRLVGFPNQKGAREGLIRVKVPLLYGFMGYRILLIRRDEQSRFNSISNLEELAKLPMGFGKGWEGHVYKYNGFTVAEPLTMESLLKMLAGKRYFFVPLSVIEIEDHYKIEGMHVDNLVPEQHLLLHMPMPVFFYVSPEFPELAERLTLGLEQLNANGQMQELFKQHFGARLKRLGLADRTLIELTNPDNDGTLDVTNHALIQEFK